MKNAKEFRKEQDLQLLAKAVLRNGVPSTLFYTATLFQNNLVKHPSLFTPFIALSCKLGETPRYQETALAFVLNARLYTYGLQKRQNIVAHHVLALAAKTTDDRKSVTALSEMLPFKNLDEATRRNLLHLMLGKTSDETNNLAPIERCVAFLQALDHLPPRTKGVLADMAAIGLLRHLPHTKDDAVQEYGYQRLLAHVHPQHVYALYANTALQKLRKAKPRPAPPTKAKRQDVHGRRPVNEPSS